MDRKSIGRSTEIDRGTELGELLASSSDNEAVATELYLRCLGREPNQGGVDANMRGACERSKTRAAGLKIFFGRW